MTVTVTALSAPEHEIEGIFVDEFLYQAYDKRQIGITAEFVGMRSWRFVEGGRGVSDA